MSGPISRRLFLGSAAAAIGGVALAGLAPGSAARAGGWKESVSANDWPLLAIANMFPIEGTDQMVALAEGDAATILTHVARRFHYEIDSLRVGDVSGYASGHAVIEPYESNYLSGSAIAIRAHSYPLGVRGSFYPREQIVVRDIIAELEGMVSWGGDERAPKESHFQIVHPPDHPITQAVAERVRDRWGGSGQPGAGAIDAFAPERLEAARSS